MFCCVLGVFSKAGCCKRPAGIANLEADVVGTDLLRRSSCFLGLSISFLCFLRVSNWKFVELFLFHFGCSCEFVEPHGNMLSPAKREWANSEQGAMFDSHNHNMQRVDGVLEKGHGSLSIPIPWIM